MYQSHGHVGYYDPYGQETYYYTTPYQFDNNYYTALNGRVFSPLFPSTGGPMGMPTGMPSGPMGPPTGMPSGPMGPPSGPPPGPPASTLPFPSPGQGLEMGQPTVPPPTAPPPSFVPTAAQAQAGVGALAIDPGSIRRCLFRNTYVWLRNRQQFWFYPIFVGRTSTSGYRWTGFRWVFFGVSLRQIESFMCA